MTYNPTADRTYWRGCGDRRLIEAARDSGHELAIALGERLEDIDWHANAMAYLETERDELSRRVDYLRAELDAWKARTGTDA